MAQEMIVARCTRGADIARSLRFPEAVCDGIYAAGRALGRLGAPGTPARRIDSPSGADRAARAGQSTSSIPMPGAMAAIDEARPSCRQLVRPGQLVAAFERDAREHSFWTALSSPFLVARVVGLVVRRATICAIDEDYLDAIAAAYGQVIDAKSP